MTILVICFYLAAFVYFAAAFLNIFKPRGWQLAAILSASIATLLI